MKKFKFNLKREVKIISVVLLLGFLIAFAERKHNGIGVQDIHINLENLADNHFMDESDVIDLMELDQENLKGASINTVDLRELENRIKAERFVQDADIYSDLKGNLVVKVTLRRPVARIVRNDGPDGYIAEDGTVMPVSEKFTSRVVLVSGNYVRQLLHQENLNTTPEGKGLMEMFSIIRKDEFWNAQIAELDIDSQAKITIYPQVGGQVLEFGKPDNLEVKFRKMKIFYKEILPRMGWNRYKRVNLEYEGQIIAE